MPPSVEAGALDPVRLLAVIETQNEIAATDLDLEAVMALVAERGRELTRAAASVIEIAEGDEMVYRVTTGTAAGHTGLRLSRSASLSGRCVETGQVLHCEDAETDDRVDIETSRRVGAMSMICVPLGHLQAGGVVGVLKVYSPEAHAFDAQDVTMLGLLSGVISAHMAHARDFEAAQRESREDGLTDLGNRRAFEEELDAAVRVAVRKGRPVALCLLDVDLFKQINDAHGHPAGDAVLRAVADVIRQGRAGDRAFRIGGDEFAVIMPDSTRAGARIVGNRIAMSLAASAADGIPVTISVGVADLGSGSSSEELYRAADAALYTAKAGRTYASPPWPTDMTSPGSTANA